MRYVAEPASVDVEIGIECSARDTTVDTDRKSVLRRNDRQRLREHIARSKCCERAKNDYRSSVAHSVINYGVTTSRRESVWSPVRRRYVYAPAGRILASTSTRRRPAGIHSSTIRWTSLPLRSKIA